ncbi:MAG: P-loop NTPase [Acidimicrobiia bacterium]|nr:P-loop NTPase [Acidimicrobiia bacterium]
MTDSGFEFDEGGAAEAGKPTTSPFGSFGGSTTATVIIDADQAVRSRLAMQLGEIAVPLGSYAALRERLTGDPMVAVLGPSCASPEGLAEAERLVVDHPEVGAVLVASELTTELFRQAIRAGIKDVLAAPVDTSSLLEAVRRVGDTVAGYRRNESAAAVDPADLGDITTVFSTKGGAGKSVIACNLAVILARRSTKPVVLVDADLQFGDVAVMLKLAPQHTIIDAVASLDRLDAALLQNLLVRHEPSGLFVLPAPLEPQFADQISAAEMVKVVELLRTFAGHIVIDTPAHFNDVVLGLIEISDDVLIVAGMDIPNIKNVKIGLQTLRLLNTPMSKLHLVLNRANSKVKLDVSEVERTLQVKAESLIPSDVVVPQSVNKGTPVVLDAPKSGVAKSLEQLADLFHAPDPGRKRR